MSVLSDKIIAKATAALEKYGLNASLHRKTKGAHDLATGNVLETTETTTIRVSPPYDYEKTDRSLTCKLILIGGEIDEDDKIEVDGVNWNVKSCSPLQINDVTVATELVLQQ